MDTWKLVCIALIFFMQAGFAMCEAGFTRAKNTGNIVMKNLMDFCLGTLAFIIIGGPLLCAQEAIAGGLFGAPGRVWGDIFGNPAGYDWTNFIFNLVFCATTSTIVSGAMAERTNFKAYCIYSIFISAIVYPIEAFWNWGCGADGNIGWLQQVAMAWGLGTNGQLQGFIDLSGSCSIHMVGGLTALIGAWVLGPRIGKYNYDENGKVVKINAIQGHNVLIGSLGVFILWFGWYGFNPAGCLVAGVGYESIGQVFMTTTVSAAFATIAVMMITWIRNGKPDVSMTLNGSLAGLVAITAACSRVSLLGSIIIGIIAGALLCFGVEFIDKVLHIDDPVGACSVHFLNGVWGTLAAGLFATDTGLFYTGSWAQLGIQLIGILATCAWTALCAFGIFFAMKAIKRKDGSSFLRATAEEEIKGLDITEHGLISAYAGFAFAPEAIDYSQATITTGETPAAEAVTVAHLSTTDSVLPEGTTKTVGEYTKIEIICKERMLDTLKNSMTSIGIQGMTVSHVMGCGVQKGKPEYYRGIEVETSLLPKIQVDIVTTSDMVSKVIDTTRKVLYTGHIGDGKIFVYDVLNVVKVRTGETGKAALVDEAASLDLH